MNTSRNILVTMLAVVTIGAGAVIWRQQVELTSLRAELRREADASAAKLRSANQRVAALERQVAEARQQSATAKRDSDGALAKSGEMVGGPNLRTMMANAADVMNRPEVQKLMAARQKAALDNSYAQLFRQLKLPADKLERLKNLLVDRQQVGGDVFAAAAQQGLDPMQNRRELARLTAEGQAKVDADIKALLGDGDYAAYDSYQATLPQRSVVNQLQQSLSYTATPLSETQAEQLVRVLADNQPPKQAGKEPVSVTRSVVTGPTGTAQVTNYIGPATMPATVTDNAVSASRSVLSEPQVQALQAVQQQQSQMRGLLPGDVPTVIQVRTSGDAQPPATPSAPAPNG